MARNRITEIVARLRLLNGDAQREEWSRVYDEERAYFRAAGFAYSDAFLLADIVMGRAMKRLRREELKSTGQTALPLAPPHVRI